jgi:hypothetical protein
MLHQDFYFDDLALERGADFHRMWHGVPHFSGFPWERHAPAWLLEPGWSPAFPGGGHWRRTDEMDI